MSIPLVGKKPEKSVKLSPAELTLLKKQRKEYSSFSRFAMSMNIDRVTMMRIMDNGYGSEPNVKKIRRKLKSLIAA